MDRVLTLSIIVLVIAAIFTEVEGDNHSKDWHKYLWGNLLNYRHIAEYAS